MTDCRETARGGITFINNAVGLIPVAIAAYCQGEFQRLPLVAATLTPMETGFFVAKTEDQLYIALTCFIGLSICYTGIWAQSLISATSFLVMVNANKFVIIGIEAFGMQTKVLTTVQLLGGTISILGGVLYGKARQAIEEVRPVRSGTARSRAGEGAGRTVQVLLIVLVVEQVRIFFGFGWGSDVVVGLGWWLRLTLMGPVEMKTAKRWNSRVLDTAVAEVDDNEGFLSMMILSAVTWLLASIAYVLGTVIDVFLELLRMTVFLLPFGLLLGYLWRFLPSQLLQTALPTLGRAGFFLSIALLYRCLAVLGETQSSETRHR
eukprot:g6832.t1